MHRFFLFSLTAASLLVAGSLFLSSSQGQDAGVSPEKEQPSIDRLASEMPRVQPKNPQESLRAMHVGRGFRVELVAAEPLVHDPVAVDFDEDGRMFVVQLPQYNGYAVEGFEAAGSISMLEDMDADGRFDKSTVYADDLNYPTAVACWDGGLFVGTAPDLLYIKDTDGDGVADLRQVVFTGFGSDKAGEAQLNSFRWGADNRFHISTNLAGGDVRATAEGAAAAVSVRGRGLIFDPRDLTRFELTSGGGQHGMSMDEWGNKFVCSNSVPAQMLMYDDRYLARNPHLEAPAAAVDIAPDGKFTKLFRVSPNEPWRVLRTRLRSDGLFRGSDEGGTPFGFFTGATGITIYRGSAWQEEYRGNLLVGDVANNLIYRATLTADGVRLVARRADDDREFLASRDIWFRPVQFANAPDGTLYFLDIYRELIEGAAFLPPEFLKYLDPISGNDRGRIYRIAPYNFQQPPRPQLGQASVDELAALLGHRNGWHRDTAARLLYQRQDRAAVGPLQEVAEKAVLPEGRLMALHALNGLDALDESTLLSALDDTTPLVRVHALRLAESHVPRAPAIRSRMRDMVTDEDLRVRYQLAFSLGADTGSQRNRALAEIAMRDGHDSWLRLAVLSSLSEGAGQVFTIVASNDTFRQTRHGEEFLAALSSQIGAANRTGEVAAVLNMLRKLPDTEKLLGQQVVEALVENQQGAAREKTLAAAGGRANEILEQMLIEARATAQDETKAVNERVEAIRSLHLSQFDKDSVLLSQLFDLRHAAEVQTAALEVLGEFDEPEVAELVIRAWPSLSPRVRARAAETLLSRPNWIGKLLDAVQQEQVGRGDLDPARIELLKKHPDAELASRVGELFSTPRLAQRQEVVEQYQSALSLDGSAENGKQIFKKICSACHQLEGVGTAAGADLKAIRNRGLPAVLLNILDPNREVKPQFLAYVISTDEGRVITGMIVSETANTLTIQRVDGTRQNIQRNGIEALRSTGLSFMPEGLEKQVTVESMADLLAYLDSIR